MNLNIGGTPLTVTVPFSRQDFVRDVEIRVKDLYNTWRREFSKRSDREVLSMVAYQFAYHYLELEDRMNKASDAVEKCLHHIDAVGEEI